MKYEELTKRLYGIQRKMMLYMMGLIVITLLLILIAVSVIVGEDARKNLMKQYGYVNDKYYNSFESMYANLESITENCITNNNVQDSLKNQELSVFDKEVLSRTLQFADEGDIDSYLYIDNKDNAYTRHSQPVDVKKLKESYLYQGLGTDYSKVKLFWEDDFISNSGEKALYAGRYVRPIERRYNPGVIYLRLDNMVWNQMVEDTKNDKPAYFLIDAKGEICLSRYPDDWKADDSTKAEAESEIQTIYQMNNEAASDGILGEKGLIYVRKQEESGFAAALLVPNKTVYQVVWQMQSLLGAVLVFVLILAFLLSHFAAAQFTRPIRYISELMENFDDSGLDSPAVLYTNTELDEIGSSYNKMLGRIADLLDQVTFKERELRKAEMDTLLYQIHPHFLYNTLDTIYMLARISREKTIMKTVKALSCYLRINLSNGAEEITIEEELQHVQSYMDIQNIRKSELFTYHVTADDKLNNIFITKMILQPIVENCIKHGFDEEWEGELHIEINVKEEDSYIVFTVENNGIRMSEKNIEKMNRLETVDISTIDSVVSGSKSGFGVWNVVKRLRLRYEGQIRFYYTVSEDKTMCVIKIKKELMSKSEKNENPDGGYYGNLPDGNHDNGRL